MLCLGRAVVLPCWVEEGNSSGKSSPLCSSIAPFQLELLSSPFILKSDFSQEPLQASAEVSCCAQWCWRTCWGCRLSPLQESFLLRKKKKKLNWGSKPHVSWSQLLWGCLGSFLCWTVSWAQREGRGFVDVKGFKWNESCCLLALKAIFLCSRLHKKKKSSLYMYV